MNYLYICLSVLILLQLQLIHLFQADACGTEANWCRDSAIVLHWFDIAQQSSQYSCESMWQKKILMQLHSYILNISTSLFSTHCITLIDESKSHLTITYDRWIFPTWLTHSFILSLMLLGTTVTVTVTWFQLLCHVTHMASNHTAGGRLWLYKYSVLCFCFVSLSSLKRSHFSQLQL